MATIVLFRQDIGNLAVEGVTAVRHPNRLRATPEGRTLVAIAIATVITASIGLAMHDAAEAFAAAFRFSFLISLPAIVGAAVYETISAGGIGALGPMAWIGGVTAFVTGYVALVILGHIIRVGRMWMFAIYLVPLGLLLIAR